MSEKDRQFAYGLAKSRTGRASEIKELLSIENNEYTTYRNRLSKRGIVTKKNPEYIAFSLPLFGDFAVKSYEMWP